MYNDNKLIENPDNVKKNIEYNEQMKKIREEVLKKFSDYRKILNMMATDAPIQILCLNKTIENALIAHGCLRIYDLINLDFTKVKGLGIRRIRDLTTRLDEFFSMS